LGARRISSAAGRAELRATELGRTGELGVIGRSAVTGVAVTGVAVIDVVVIDVVAIDV
jgi:hypothetical protein